MAISKFPPPENTYQRKHGFEVTSAGAATQTISYSNSTKKITVTPVGGHFTFWINGVKFIKVGAQTSGAHGTTTGKYFFYYDATGTLQVSAVETPWRVRDRTVTPVALVFWNNSLGDGICFYECHTADRTLEQHYHDHFSLSSPEIRLRELGPRLHRTQDDDRRLDAPAEI